MAKTRTAGNKDSGMARRATARAPVTKPPEKEREKSAASAPKPARAARRFGVWPWLALLVVVPLLIYGRVLSFPFAAYDDGRLVFGNQWYYQINLESFLHFWRYPFYDEYDPIVYDTFALLAALSHSLHLPAQYGLSPSIFHAACLVLHIANGLLVFALLRGLGYQAHASFLGSLLFAVQPLQVESVGYIGEMDTPLATFFCLLALWQYVIYAKAEGAGSRRWIHFGLASAAYAVALVSKPLAVCAPVMALVLELLLFRRPLRSFGWPLAGWFAAALGLGAWTHHIHVVPSVVSTALWQRPFLAGDSLAFYLVKLFDPWPMAFIYGRNADVVLHHWWGYCTWVLPVLVGIASWKLYRRFPELATGFGLMIAGTLPVLGFLQYQMEQWSDVADRYMYLSMVGPALVLAGLVTRLRQTRLNTPALAGIYALLLVGCVLSARQLSYWRSSIALYRHSLDVCPAAEGVHVLLAHSYWVQNDGADAAAEYCTAARLSPHDGDLAYVAANGLLVIGHGQEAIPYFELAIKDKPSLDNAHFGLGLVYAEAGQTAQAANQWQIAAQLVPSNPDYHYNLGLALLRLARYQDAAQQFRDVLALQPGSSTAQARLDQALQGEEKGLRHSKKSSVE